MKFKKFICFLLTSLIVVGTVGCGEKQTIPSLTQDSEQNNSASITREVKKDQQSVFLGEWGTAAITTDGTLYTWGDNVTDTLGIDSVSNSNDEVPTPTALLSDAKSVYLSNGIPGAITASGDLYVWGYTEIELDLGTDGIQPTPVKLMSDVSSFSQFDNSYAVLTTNGDLYMWGSNEFGQIGTGSTDDQRTPVKILTDVVEVDLEHNHTAAITKNGDLYTWGENGGIIGNTSLENQLTPVKVLENVVDVESDFDYTVALTEKGDLYAWGYCGHLGGSYMDVKEAAPQKILSGITFINETDGHFVFITSQNDFGTLHYDSSAHLTRVTEKIVSDARFVRTRKGCYAVITNTGDLYTGGGSWNNYGILGNGTDEIPDEPTLILSDVKDVKFSDDSCAALKTNGDLYTWGCNRNGQIGNGTTLEQLSPLKIMTNIAWFDTRYSPDFYSNIDCEGMAAITTDGDLYLWGGGVTPNDFSTVSGVSSDNPLIPVKFLENVRIPEN